MYYRKKKKNWFNKFLDKLENIQSWYVENILVRLDELIRKEKDDYKIPKWYKVICYITYPPFLDIGLLRYLFSKPVYDDCYGYRWHWLDRQRTRLDTIICRWRGHPCGVVWYNLGGYEPNMTCKNCGDDLG